jgi:hypothetical protein
MQWVSRFYLHCGTDGSVGVYDKVFGPDDRMGEPIPPPNPLEQKIAWGVSTNRLTYRTETMTSGSPTSIVYGWEDERYEIPEVLCSVIFVEVRERAEKE